MSYCNRCGSSNTYGSCGCSAFNQFAIESSCNSQADANGCYTQTDVSCVIYGKNNNQVSGLQNLDLPNGSTLKLVLDTIDSQLEGADVTAWSLPTLRGIPYTINTLKQFGEAVDSQLTELTDAVDDVTGVAAVPITPLSSATVTLGVSGVNNHSLTASVKVSPASANLITPLLDGLYVAPQTLTVDYVTKKIGISNGNTIDMLNFCGCEDCNGFKGNVSSDPVTPVAGQFWYNTSANELRIFVNNAKYKIALTAV